MTESDRMRQRVSSAQYPRLLLASAGLIVVLSALNWWEEPEASVTLHIMDVLAAAVLLVIGLLLLRAPIAPAVQPWLFSIGFVSVLASLLYQAWLTDRPVVMTYAVIVFTAMGPMMLYWRPFLAASALGLIMVTLAVTNWEAGHPSEWQLVTGAAILVSAVLLQMRLNALDALADATARAEHLAITDELTGLLNRHGLNEQLPRLAAMARRLDKPLFAVFVDIDGLKAANDRHGHAFGDEVIQLSRQAVLASVRGGDLVARWGGDEIVVVGIGEHPSPEPFAARLDSYVTSSGVDRGRWPGHLSAGFAQGEPAEDIEALIEEADHDMYRRRRSARG